MSKVLASTFVFLLAASLASADVPVAGGHCGDGSFVNAWLDIVFLVDSSKAMTQSGLYNVRSFIQSTLFLLRLGPTAGPFPFYTRAGIISYANQATVLNPLDLDSSNLRNIQIPLQDQEGTNLEDAIAKGLDLFEHRNDNRHAQQVFIVIASNYRTGNYQDPNEIAEHFREDGGILMTVAYQQPHSAPIPLLQEIASKNYNFSNSDPTFSPGDLLNAFTYANCFCPDQYLPLSGNPFGAPDVGCIDEVTLPSNKDSAVDDCGSKGARLLKVNSNELNAAVTVFAGDTDIWIDLQRSATDPDTFRDGDGIVLQPEDFEAWAPGEPKSIENGDCVVSRKGVWYVDYCYVFYDYVCDAAPCSVVNDCFIKITTTTTNTNTPSSSTSSAASTTSASSSTSTTTASSTTTTTSERNV